MYLNDFAFHFDAGLWAFLQIEIPIGVIVPAPIRLDDQISTLIKEIGNWDAASLAGFPSGGIQDQDGLRAKLAANPSTCKADETGIHAHEPFDQHVFH